MPPPTTTETHSLTVYRSFSEFASLWARLKIMKLHHVPSLSSHISNNTSTNTNTNTTTANGTIASTDSTTSSTSSNQLFSSPHKKSVGKSFLKSRQRELDTWLNSILLSFYTSNHWCNNDEVKSLIIAFLTPLDCH